MTGAGLRRGQECPRPQKSILFDDDGDAALDDGGELQGVPVREAEAAVRFGLADVLGRGAAVDAGGGGRGGRAESAYRGRNPGPE